MEGAKSFAEFPPRTAETKSNLSFPATCASEMTHIMQVSGERPACKPLAEKALWAFSAVCILRRNIFCGAECSGLYMAEKTLTTTTAAMMTMAVLARISRKSAGLVPAYLRRLGRNMVRAGMPSGVSGIIGSVAGTAAPSKRRRYSVRSTTFPVWRMKLAVVQ